MAKQKKVISTLPAEVLAAVAELEKHYGKGSVMRLGDNLEFADIKSQVPTGSLAIDAAIGVFRPNADGATTDHGIPHGKIVEIFGPESCGKTTLCNHIIAQAQSKGGLCGFIDMEQAWDRAYASKVGVNVEELMFSQPDCGEQALKTLELFVKTAKFSVVVLDSVASLAPRAELEGDMGDSQPGLQARLMSQALRKLTALINNSQTLVIFTNQMREKIMTYGNPETTPGGNALKYYATLRFDMRKIAAIKDPNGEMIGHRTKLKVIKNKIAPPFQTAEFDMIYGLGIVPELDLIECACNLEIIQQKGAWFAYEESMLGQGKTNTADALRENKVLFDKITAQVLAKYLGKE
jgi:recombination protein RecA